VNLLNFVLDLGLHIVDGVFFWFLNHVQVFDEDQWNIIILFLTLSMIILVAKLGKCH